MRPLPFPRRVDYRNCTRSETVFRKAGLIKIDINAEVFIHVRDIEQRLATIKVPMVEAVAA